MRLRLLSVACAPLVVKDEIFGVIYIDNRDLAAVFDENTGNLLNEFSALISVAVKNALDRKSLLDTERQLLAERDASPATVKSSATVRRCGRFSCSFFNLEKQNVIAAFEKEF